MRTMIAGIGLAWTALAAGFATAGGFVAFISLVGIVPRLSAITKTASRIPLYETSLALGLIAMNVLSLYPVDLTWVPRIVSAALMNAGEASHKDSRNASAGVHERGRHHPAHPAQIYRL